MPDDASRPLIERKLTLLVSYLEELSSLVGGEPGGLPGTRSAARLNAWFSSSSVPPGTTRGVVLPLLERASGIQAGRDFHLAFCPERALPGRLVEELVRNDRGLPAAGGTRPGGGGPGRGRPGARDRHTADGDLAARLPALAGTLAPDPCFVDGRGRLTPVPGFRWWRLGRGFLEAAPGTAETPATPLHPEIKKAIR